MALATQKRQHNSSSWASISTRASSSASICDEAGRSIAGDNEAREASGPPAARTPRFSSRALVLTSAAVVLAALWSRYITRVMRRPHMWGPGRLAVRASTMITSLAALLGITSWSQVKAQPQCVPPRQSIVVFHPHGCYVFGGIINLGREPRNKHSPLHQTFIGVADALFKIPGIREFLLLLNSRPANPRMVETLLKDGKSVALCPGGIHEQMATDPSRERCFFPPNLGFVRQAMKHGVPLLPVYTFGENQLFDVPGWSRALSQAIKRLTGAGVPLAVGRWGLPFVPKKVDLRTYVGRPVDTGAPDPSPSDSRVREVFFAYCAELQRLFKEHGKAALPAAVAHRGLELVWRGHEHEKLDPNDEHVSDTFGEIRNAAAPEFAQASKDLASRL